MIKAIYNASDECKEINMLRKLDHDCHLIVNRNEQVLSHLKVGDEAIYIANYHSEIPRRYRCVVTYIHPEGRYIGIRTYSKETGELNTWMTCVKPYEIDIASVAQEKTATAVA